jgi:hypothetical protein
VIAAVLAVALIGAVLVNSLRHQRADAGAGQPRTSAATSLPAPGTARAVPQYANDADVGPPVPTVPPRPGDHVLPQGWSWYADASGFRIGVPQGWTISRADGRVYFRDAPSGRTLAVEPIVQPDLSPLAWTDAQEKSRLDNGEFPKYTVISKTPVTVYQGGADWEFTFDSPRGATRLHALIRAFRVSPQQGYAIWWLTRELDWSPTRPLCDLAIASFHPAA